MRGHVETISGYQQNSALGCGLAERACVLAVEEPREGRHSALRADPAENVAVGSHEAIQMPQILAGSFPGLPENRGVVADRDLGEDFPRSAVADGEIGAGGPVLLAPPGVALDHPSSARSCERESL